MKRLFTIATSIAVTAFCASANAIIIVPQTVTGPNGTFINSINGSGLVSPLQTGAAEPATYPMHVVGDTSEAGLGNPTLEEVAGRVPAGSLGVDPELPLDYSLGGVFNLTGLKLWNYGERFEGFYYNDRGINEFSLEFSSDNGATYSAPVNLTAAIADVDTNILTGLNYYAPETFTLSQAGVTTVRLRAASNHGGNWTGIGELAFTGAYVFRPGDYNSDGAINLLDWPAQRDNYQADLTGLTLTQRFQKGDFDLDGDNDLQDQFAFKAAFLLAGNSAAALGAVPEPGSLVLLALGGLALVRIRRAKASVVTLAAIAAVAISTSANAEIIQPVSVTSPNATDTFTRTIDGSGLSSPLASGDAEPAVYPTHQVGSTNPEIGPIIEEVLGRFGDASPDRVIDFRLGARSNLTGMVFWNYSEEFEGAYYNGRGLTSMDVQFSTDGGNTYSGPTTLTASIVPDGPSPFAPQVLPLTASNVTNVRLSNLLNDGLSNRVGFGEVRFTGEQLKLTLEVNPSNGNARILNSTGLAVNLDFVELTSSTSSLDPTNWTPLGDGLQNGLNWDVLGSSTTQRLSQLYLGGSGQPSSASLAAGGSLTLGKAFQGTGSSNVGFVYRDPVVGGVVNGDVQFTGSGDYDGSGSVDGADFLLWQRNVGASNESAFAAGSGNGGGVDGTDLAVWRGNFGSATVNGTFATSAVPEPTAGLLALLGLVGGVLLTRRQSSFSGWFCPGGFI